MTTTQPVTTTARAGQRALRGNCMGAAVLLVIQFGLGTAINLYVTLPTGKSFWSKVFSDGAVAVHAIVALLLIGASVSALVRSIRARDRLLVALTSAGLAAIIVAAAAAWRSCATEATARRCPWRWPPRWHCSATWPRSSPSAAGQTVGRTIGDHLGQRGQADGASDGRTDGGPPRRLPGGADRIAAGEGVFRVRFRLHSSSGDERRDWSFVPAPDRTGLPIGALDEGQRRLAHELIVTGTSLPGYAKVVSVMAMEHVLRALRPDAAGLFDPERYCFKVFGQPDELVWGWQFAGHHVSLNYTIADGRFIAPTPCLLGAEPARYGTLDPLADDEELGFEFVHSLDPPSGAPRSFTTGRRPTSLPGWCPASATPNGPTRCSVPSPTTCSARTNATSSATSAPPPRDCPPAS